jgi:2-polyprenyl-3-methyl-5-hydroxy-6-metoxy-1,4-benzoquinol methylase
MLYFVQICKTESNSLYESDEYPRKTQHRANRQEVPAWEAAQLAAYWRTQSYQARLEALEQIRQEYIRWKYDADPGFQRVCNIIKR